MRRTLKFITAAACAVLALTGCQKTSSPGLGSIAVTLGTSEIFTSVPVEGITVTLTNTADQTTKTAVADANGVVVFEDLASSTYNATAAVELTSEQALDCTGLDSDITLSGAANDIVVSLGSDVVKTITLDGSTGGSLVIKEIYGLGAANDNYSVMFRDTFVEIYNNSAEVQYVDGLYLMDIGNGDDGASDTGVPFGLPVDEYVYAAKVIQFPGNGTDYPVEPGKSVIVAMNAVNYIAETEKVGATEAITVDNSTADFDTYFGDWMVENGGADNPYFDVENNDVPTMICNYHNNLGGFFNIYNLPSMALVDIDELPTETVKDPASPTSETYYLKVPASAVIDGVEVLAKSSSTPFKCFNTTIDAGFYCLESNVGGDPAITGIAYSGNSFRRKLAKTMPDGRNVLCDTNNSTNDLEIIAKPSPRCYNK